MIRILSILMGAMLLTSQSFAQVNENFENGLTVLSDRCWQFNNTNYASSGQSPNYVINGNGSIYSNPPVNNSNYRTVATPYLKVTGNTISLSFLYKISSKLHNNATRIVDVGLVNSSGVFTSLSIVTLDSTASVITKLLQVNNSPVTPGAYRVMIKLGGKTGDGNSRLSIDDLSIDANYYYSTYCNPAPVANDDSYEGLQGGTFQGSSVMQNDQDPDGETMIPSLVTNSPDGNVTMNNDGTFVFIPNPGFNGQSTSFTYKVVDNGYDPASSNTATVQIEFKPVSQAVIGLIDFKGQAKNQKIDLDWEVSFNDMIAHFDVEKSSNGTDFTKTKIVTATNKAGREKYTFSEPATASKIYYRLKIVGTNSEVEYSKIISLNVNGSGIKHPITIINNPVPSGLVFNYTSQENENIVVNITTATGINIYSATNISKKGMNQYTINMVSSLSPGVYVLVITNSKGERYSTMFVKL